MAPFPLGIMALAGAGGFTPPGDTWTYYTSPISSSGDVYYDPTFQKWYVGPRGSGNIYSSTDGTTWTNNGISTNYNAGKFQRANGKLFFNAAYNPQGSPQSGYHYTTDGSNWNNNSGPFSGMGRPAEDNYGNYVASKQESNYSDYYATSTNGLTWVVSSTPQANDSYGNFSAGIFSCWSDYSYVYRAFAGSLASAVAVPSGNAYGYSFLLSDKITYLWDGSWSGNSRLWTFDGTTFTQVGVARPVATTYEIGVSIAIVGEALLPGEFMANFATGYTSVNDARLYTPKYGHKYVLSYYPDAYGAAYSPDANMYLTRSGSVSGSYYIMKSIG